MFGLPRNSMSVVFIVYPGNIRSVFWYRKFKIYTFLLLVTWYIFNLGLCVCVCVSVNRITEKVVVEF